jgi:ribosomal protein S18 acetylase RimI-like enzyme
VISLSMPSEEVNCSNCIRPINLRTDLGQLADLMEIAFRNTMDESSRSALRDMRYLSKMGIGLAILSRLNELALGINKGFVWVEDKRILGNVSILPANWHSQVGNAWMIVNVAVHPDYRRRGIARRLMRLSMEAIQEKKANHAILQVDYDNDGAVGLYESLGFVRERAFTTWTRSAYTSSPPASSADNIFITYPRSSEWQAEYELAQQARPNEQGGIAWQKPLHTKYFRPSFLQRILSVFALSGTERLIVRDESERDILATLWLERSIALSQTTLTFMQQPNAPLRYADALFSTVLRRYRTSGFKIEHPHDDTIINDLLTDYRFHAKRTVWHMRYDL